MVLATASFVICDSCMKLVMADAEPMQVLFMRGVAACVWCLPLLFILGHGKHIASLVNRWVLLLAFCEVIAVMSFVIALAKMPIADITAFFQISPLLLLLGVSLIWGERLGSLRWFLISLGIGGAIMVAQPGMPTASPYAIFGFVTAIASAARDLVARNIPQNIPVLVATFTTLVIVMSGAALASMAFEEWVSPSPRHLLLMAVSGLFLIFGHMFVFLAFRLASAGTVAPFYYAFTIWAVASGLIIFGVLPNALAIAGMALIVTSGIANIAIEQRQRRSLKTAPIASRTA
jgi:drug/metabolite transporter (DMT)-like permease